MSEDHPMPPDRPRRLRLDTPGAIRAHALRLFREAARGARPAAEAAALVDMLSAVHGMMTTAAPAPTPERTGR
jgi:hypothetical protein